MLLHKLYVLHLGNFVFLAAWLLSIFWNLRGIFIIRVWLGIDLVLICIFFLGWLLFPVIIMLFIPVFKVRKAGLICVITRTLIEIFVLSDIILIVIMVKVRAVNWKNMAAHLWIIHLHFIIERSCSILASCVNHFMHLYILLILTLIFEKILFVIISFLKTIVFFFFLEVFFVVICLWDCGLLRVLRWYEIKNSVRFVLKNHLLPGSEDRWY